MRLLSAQPLRIALVAEVRPESGTIFPLRQICGRPASSRSIIVFEDPSVISTRLRRPLERSPEKTPSALAGGDEVMNFGFDQTVEMTPVLAV
jgi:hypothetical protein